MINGIRKAAMQAPQPLAAKPLVDDPTARLEAMYRRIWIDSMRDLPFVNLALSVEAIGFRRWHPASSLTAAADSPRLPASAATGRLPGSGDWVGALITPWFINLMVLPGGGELWSDRPAGERCHIDFPIGPLEFIADNDAAAEIPAYQYCPLFAPPGHFASQAAARAAAMAALEAMFATPEAACAAARLAAAEQPERASRRSFMRRIARSQARD